MSLAIRFYKCRSVAAGAGEAMEQERNTPPDFALLTPKQVKKCTQKQAMQWRG